MKCNVKKCKASCCYNVPFPKGFVSLHKDAIVNKILTIKDIPPAIVDGCVCHEVVFTSYEYFENKCPFLTNEYTCNVYNYRPMICRKFGETEKLKCNEWI